MAKSESRFYVSINFRWFFLLRFDENAHKEPLCKSSAFLINNSIFHGCSSRESSSLKYVLMQIDHYNSWSSLMYYLMQRWTQQGLTMSVCDSWNVYVPGISASVLSKLQNLVSLNQDVEIYPSANFSPIVILDVSYDQQNPYTKTWL